MDGDDTLETIVITDTSILINFLVLDQIALLVSLPGKKFVITDHVRAEISDHFPQQLNRIESALADELLEEIKVDDFAELTLFAQLTGLGLGVGECSAMAVAIHRGHSLAIDDKRAVKKLRKQHSNVPVLTTEDLVVQLIRADLLSVATADAMKLHWEVNHRFLLKFESFDDLL